MIFLVISGNIMVPLVQQLRIDISATKLHKRYTINKKRTVQCSGHVKTAYKQQYSHSWKYQTQLFTN